MHVVVTRMYHPFLISDIHATSLIHTVLSCRISSSHIQLHADDGHILHLDRDGKGKGWVFVPTTTLRGLASSTSAFFCPKRHIVLCETLKEAATFFTESPLATRTSSSSFFEFATVTRRNGQLLALAPHLACGLVCLLA